MLHKKSPLNNVGGILISAKSFTIRNTVEELYGESSGSGVRILYGGSVTPDNAKAYLNLDSIDGLLVGGASLNYEEFIKIIKVAQKA